MHVWTPPTLENVVGKKVIVAGIDGPSDVAKTLEEQLFLQAPKDAGRELQMVSATDMNGQGDIQLVRYDGTAPSDVSLHHLAKQQGYDFVLRGQVLQRRHQRIRSFGNDDEEDAEPKSAEPLILSWQLSDVTGRTAPIGRPISLTLEAALDLHPDLAFAGDEQTSLLAAAARETNRLVLPSIERTTARLSVPYGLPGSRAVRRGNQLAAAGRWAEAKQTWQEVASENPLQVAALVNLSLAHAAEQDFETARKLARKAIRRAPSKLAQETLVWIELRQRDYHRAFGLPDPAGGWFVTR